MGKNVATYSENPEFKCYFEFTPTVQTIVHRIEYISITQNDRMNSTAVRWQLGPANGLD